MTFRPSRYRCSKAHTPYGGYITVLTRGPCPPGVRNSRGQWVALEEWTRGDPAPNRTDRSEHRRTGRTGPVHNPTTKLADFSTLLRSLSTYSIMYLIQDTEGQPGSLPRCYAAAVCAPHRASDSEGSDPEAGLYRGGPHYPRPFLHPEQRAAAGSGEDLNKEGPHVAFWPEGTRGCGYAGGGHSVAVTTAAPMIRP